jgi:hypothetical protein
LREKIFDQPATVFFFDSREQSRAEFSDCSGSIERQAIVHFSATEVARHAFRFEDWFELSIEIDSRFLG